MSIFFNDICRLFSWKTDYLVFQLSENGKKKKKKSFPNPKLICSNNSPQLKDIKFTYIHMWKAGTSGVFSAEFALKRIKAIIQLLK